MCIVVEKLSKPCTFQECQPLCIQKYKGTGN
ncbi:BnaC07g41880D [Brassica napus]|uniref:BnaC07g41880D protein n=1 Tax=Brassica napus TaxID=3708 RepID=A0A078ICB7_BRANA|nr:BnaC07g41880D [Brassica napus]